MKNMQENSTMTHWRALALAMTLSLGLQTAATAQTAEAPAAAANAIQAISSTQQSGVEVIRIELSQPLSEVPRGFMIQTPPRIAIDLPGVNNAMGRPSVEINQGNLRSANVAQSGERTRVVLNLKQPSSYRAQLQGNALLVILETAAVPSAADAVHFAPSLNANPLALKDIDFRRGQDGTGRVIVNLPNNQVGVDIKQQGKTLVVEFLRSTLPESLRRRLDVSDFGTPVQNITTTQSADRVRMVVEPRGDWEHSAYQSDNQFVLEVRPQKVDPNKLTQGPGYAGDKLSLNFQNIEVRALLQVIADFTNFNVVTSDTVTGNVTLRLKDVPWDQALDIILQAKGLGLRKSGNVLWIAPKDELAAKEKVDLESKAAIAQLEPVRTQSFQLNYTKAEEVAKGLSGQSGAGGGTASRILSTRGSVIYETRTNQLFVSDIPSKLEEIQAMIAKIDIPVRQVLIEARIVEADDKFGRSLGVKLGTTDLRGIQGGVPGVNVGGNNYITAGNNYNAIGYQTKQPGSTAPVFANSQMINMPAGGIEGGTPATFALSLFSASSNRFLNLELSALEADGKGKVISSPRVITADQVKALIEQGEEIPYQVSTSSGATATTFRKASLKLEVTPQITPEGNVILDVDVTNDSKGASTNQGFTINTKHVKTQVLVENGGTVVIGGIYTQNEREDVTKVPWLGDMPVLGNLFKSRTRSNNKTELLVFITPKVVSERAATR
ncbi:type IV pilus secretin PilQ [Roseateles toxinivorans]|uniref:Type IV pilus biogenesis and competence protein PilQ n=1 Tax=Roseateles toxinivorans TaxID=270368 RepID=A0A4R6QHU7_9BURK|nr:type IV pilus secretin PilQ [Roseateles toxinivorans]TDP62771.1 type IV pilus assembly protein PilQ [Roseateles toxinivorans]